MTTEREAFLRSEAGHDVRIADCVVLIDALREDLRATRAELAGERVAQAGRDKVVEMAAARVTEIAAERDAARAALRQVEWSGEQYGAEVCPACDARPIDGHRPKCVLGRALRPSS